MKKIPTNARPCRRNHDVQVYHSKTSIKSEVELPLEECDLQHLFQLDRGNIGTQTGNSTFIKEQDSFPMTLLIENPTGTSNRN